MITMTNDQLEKIHLLDKLFGSLNIEQLRVLVETEAVASKLRGDNADPGILSGLIQDNQFYSIEIMNTKSDIVALKTDFETLIRVMKDTLYSPTYNQDFQNLKQKHNIY